ncbi:MAG: CinA family protein [Deltaproteobacteria bacterium]|nr:CinA family protein [Deltaproteobacteria bacterium]
MRPAALEQEVAELLLNLGKTIAVAESCTGGLISHRLTNVSGSSAYFEMGLITYSNRSKTAMLGVSADLIRSDGAVSEACVRAMASGVRVLAGTDLGLAVSGIAGPTGGTVEKPVGTVHLALASPEGVQAWRFLFQGDRESIKGRASDEALARVRDYCRSQKNG